jgi:hypothetical protein
MFQSQGGMPDQPQAEELETTYTWEKPVIKVKNLKEKKTFNGYECNHYIATITTVGKHVESGQKDTMVFKSDFWNSIEAEKVMGSATEFNKNYMKALGFSLDNNKGLAMITGMYSDQMKDLEKEVGKVKGFTIKNNMKLTMTQNFKSETEEGQESVSLDDIKDNFGSLLGKKMLKKKTKKSADEKTNARVIIDMSFETRDISTEKFSLTLLKAPKGYKLKKKDF